MQTRGRPRHTWRMRARASRLIGERSWPRPPWRRRVQLSPRLRNAQPPDARPPRLLRQRSAPSRRIAGDPRPRPGAGASVLDSRGAHRRGDPGTSRSHRVSRRSRQDVVHCTRESLPLVSSLAKSTVALLCEAVDAPSSTRRRRPPARDEAASLESVESRVERSLEQVELPSASFAQPLDQEIAVRGSVLKARQKHEVEVTLEKIRPHT